MTQMIHSCDEERCIACHGCVIACKEGNEVPVGVNRRWVITINEGTREERSISHACRHCEEPFCLEACPADAISKRADGIVQVDRDKCVSCESCADACPFGVPEFERDAEGSPTSPMEKCSFCAGGPNVETFSEKEKELYGQNRIAEGKPVLCSSMCATKALVSGEKGEVEGIMEARVAARGLWL